MIDSTWNNNDIQFARLIAEAEASGLFTNENLETLAGEMGLFTADICELIDRAQHKWDNVKKRKVKSYAFTKSLMESNAYDYVIKAHSLEEAIELAKKPENCPVYPRTGGYFDSGIGSGFELRYAEGDGDQILEWRDAENKIHRFNLDP